MSTSRLGNQVLTGFERNWQHTFSEGHRNLLFSTNSPGAYVSTQIAISSALPTTQLSGVDHAPEILEAVRSQKAKIAVLGMGHVGLPTALSFAEAGWQVVGADSAPSLISTLRAGKAPFYEPGVEELLQKHVGKRFQPRESIAEAIREADIVFICVGTPQKSSGEADLSQIEAVARAIACNLNGYKLIVEKSTVPAITALWIKRTISRYAGNRPAREAVQFDVASNPEFLQEGVALKNVFHPVRIVCGVESKLARKILQEVYRRVGSPVLMTGLSTAEIIKHAANSFLSMKISFINMVSDLCDTLGADVAEVAQGIGMDPRIGRDFLHAGIGFGGYCFPKDLRAFIYLAEMHGVDFSLLKSVEAVNRSRVDMFMRKMRNALWMLNGKTIGVLGLAFKAGTDDTRESPSLRVVEALLDEGASLRIHDPKAMEILRNALPEQQGRLRYCKTAYEAAEGAHALAILTDWPEYRELAWDQVRDQMEIPLVVDGRNLLEPTTLRRAGFEYIGMGR